MLSPAEPHGSRLRPLAGVLYYVRGDRYDIPAEKRGRRHLTEDDRPDSHRPRKGADRSDGRRDGMSRPTLSAKTSTASATKKPDNRRDILLAVSQGIAVLAGEVGIWYVMVGRGITIAIFLGFLFAAIIVPLAVREAYH